MVVVVGASGAGKDSLIDYARARRSERADILFVRRAITRNAEAGGEDHEPVSSAEFERRRAEGGFAVHWSAHGLDYGIPYEARAFLAHGGIAIANGSRSVLSRFAAAFPRLLVVNVVARPDILASRLRSRGRETQDDITARLVRSEAFAIPEQYRCITIDNSGTLPEAGEQLLAALDRLVAAHRL
ncbi:phosphonate metabolism protein/1,5-bisphosphokinase (PRPP-forming) PhnN [Rhizobium sp. SAFR-030]|uniref:phosphonate metabolism protein/1,5-bisphosphokinase (PRPP-forming) PhnN n=1 Tax=Rhizobium sp. SAFR-030 TaxID=3387277 RepID=UPI003F8089A2